MWAAGSWDRFIIALPFGRGVVIYGDPIRVPRKLDEGERQALLEQVEISITAATDQADRMMGHVPIPPADRRAMASESAS